MVVETGALLLAAAKAVAAKLASEATGSAMAGAKKRVLGDPETTAIAAALGRAWARTEARYQQPFRAFDVNPSFLQYEAATELANVLLPNRAPSSARLAEACVDSLSPRLDPDTRFDRVVTLRPAFQSLLDAYREELGAERQLDAIGNRVDASRAAAAVEAMTGHLGATPATAADESSYLHWLIDTHRYLRTAGMVRNNTVQIPLSDVFVSLSGERDLRPGDRAETWLKHERQKLDDQLAAGELSAESYEAALDQLVLQLGHTERPLFDDPATPPVDVLAEVRGRAQLLVLGDPGSGKTTLLRYLALCHASALVGGHPDPDPKLGQVRFPIFVRVGDFARSEHRAKGLGSFLAEYVRSQECRAPGLADLFRRKLADGNCLVLLDGLDEVAAADERRAVVNAATSFVTANARQGNRFVVTSRIAGYLAAPLPPAFGAVRVQDMDDATIKRFLQVYCPAIERAEAPQRSAEMILRGAQAAVSGLEEALRQSPGVRRLAANPLLLTALLLVHRARGRLPDRRVDAYVEVSEALGRTWRSVQGVPEADLPDDRMLTTWLTRVGSWMHQNRPEGSATKRELLEVLGPLWAALNGTIWDPDLLKSADSLNTDAGRGTEDFLVKTDVHTGLLVERAPGRYGFPHLTFEEYYAGRALAFEGLSADRASGIRQRLHDPRYEEPILLALGLVGREQPEEVERLVFDAVFGNVPAPSEYEELLGRDFLFALRTLADDIPLQTASIDVLIEQALAEWFDPTSRVRFPPYRAALSAQLAGLGASKAGRRFAAAVEALAADDRPARPFIALAAIVGELGPLTSNIIARLQAILTGDDEPAVRVQAGRALAAAGVLAPAVEAELARIVTGDAELAVRVQAGQVLAHAGRLEPLVAAELVTIVGGDAATELRVQAGQVLARAGALEAPVNAALIEIVTSDANPSVRVAAAQAVGETGSLALEVRAALIAQAAEHASATTRSNAAQVLGQLSPLTPESTAVLTGLATGDPDSRVRVEAGWALGQGGSLAPGVAAALVAVLEGTTDARPWVRTRAAEALDRARLCTPRVIAALVAMVTGDDEPWIRATAAEVLGRTGPLAPSVATVLAEIVTSADEPWVRAKAAQVLRRVGPLAPEVISALVGIVGSDAEPWVRLVAGRALSEVGPLPADVVTALIGIVGSDAEPWVRGSVASLLGKQRSLTRQVAAALVDLIRTETDELVLDELYDEFRAIATLLPSASQPES